MPQLTTKKRSSNYDEYAEIDAVKKQKEDIATKLRLLIVGRYAGGLIGKGGENFKKLREEYSVKITGLSSRASARVLQLDGDRENCISIVKEVLPLCPESPYPAQNGQKCAFELNILVNTDQVGSVIGKGGSRLREISELSGAKLNVIADCLPNSNERVVSIGGDDQSQVIAGLDAVFDVLENYPGKTQTIYFKPSDGTASPESRTPGSVISGGITPVPSNTPLNFANEVNVAAVLSANREHKRGKSRDANTDFGLVQTVTTLTVPHEMCGAIIGKGGMNLKQVYMASGAKVDCVSSSPGSKEDRTITVTGTQEQVQIAEQVIAQNVRNSNNLRRSSQA